MPEVVEQRLQGGVDDLELGRREVEPERDFAWLNEVIGHRAPEGIHVTAPEQPRWRPEPPALRLSWWGAPSAVHDRARGRDRGSARARCRLGGGRADACRSFAAPDSAGRAGAHRGSDG